MYHRFQELLSKLLLYTKVTEQLWKRLPGGLYVFNYHRIGIAEASDYDHAIFSCTSEAFDEHVSQLKKNFTIINCAELATLLELGTLTHNRYAIITFDDGYIDNYTNAFPILKKHNVSGSFYIATDFVDSNHIPWWDEIAFILRNSYGQTYQLPSSSSTFVLDKKSINQTIRKIMNAAKLLRNYSILEVLGDIRARFPKAVEKLQLTEPQLFMNWSQINEMATSGMEIGSHTLSHRILSQLSKEEQKEEICNSKELIEKMLSSQVISIAYPVGRYHCYNQTSFEQVKAANYLIGFNNEPGSHRSIRNPFDINRYCVARNDLNYLKFECCFK